MVAKKRSKIAVFNTPRGQIRRKFTSVRELALRWPSSAQSAGVGREQYAKRIVPSSTEYMTVTSQRDALGNVGVTGFYRDYDKSIRKIEGEFNTRAINAMIRGRGGKGGLKGLGASSRSRSLSPKRAREIFTAAPSPGEAPTLYGSMSPTPRFKPESVARLSAKRMSAARGNPDYLPAGIALYGDSMRVNPSRRGFAARRPMGMRRNPPMGAAAEFLARENPTNYLASGLFGSRSNPVRRRRRIR